jgi:hypothetical protein
LKPAGGWSNESSSPQRMTKTTQQVEALFDAACQLANPAARRTFLDEACAGDATLRTRVEALLAAQSDADKFFREIAPFSNTPKPGAGRATTDMASAGTGIPAEQSVPTEGPGSRIEGL